VSLSLRLTNLVRYVFPGIGLGAILSKATKVTDNMIYASGASLPEMLSPDELATGMLYPALDRIREVSVRVARNVVRAAQGDKVDRADDLRDMKDEALDDYLRSKMYDPFKNGQ
jgi:malate dehydrogenase (oxaloacetate-decarboxylating)(NADP+)